MTTITKTSNHLTKKQLLGAAIITGAILFSPGIKANAAGAGAGTLQTELANLASVTTALQGICTGFTQVAILPIGISAGVHMFKMMVLKCL